MSEFFKSIKQTVWEMVKWGGIFWLIFPVIKKAPTMFDAFKMITGAAFVIIFSGKRLYDSLFEGTQTGRKNWWVDVLLFLGIIASFALLIFAVIIAVMSLINTSQLNEEGAR
jgi:hypothetical protein